MNDSIEYKTICALRPDQIHRFLTIPEAVDFLIENNLTTNKNRSTLRSGIYRAINKSTVAWGFRWVEIQEFATPANKFITKRFEEVI